MLAMKKFKVYYQVDPGGMTQQVIVEAHGTADAAENLKSQGGFKITRWAGFTARKAVERFIPYHCVLYIEEIP
jgi:uncharacterized protein (UPF0248 family)